MKSSLLKAGILGLLVTGAALAAFAPAPTALTFVPESFDYDPPVALHAWVTKLDEPLKTGENVTMRVEFEPRDSMPAILPVYLTDDDSVQFRDDGVAPDESAEDFSYAAYVTEDLDILAEEISSLYTAFEDEGHLLKFTGHAGQQVEELQPFDDGHFETGGETEIPLDVVWVKRLECTWAKQKTLFITDLSVVEDPTRTYDVFNDAGTAMGAWTFGKLIEDLVNTSTTGVTTKDFLESWLLHWTQQQTVNGQTVATREGVVHHLIEPWLRKCDLNIGVGDVTLSNWQSLWNQSSVTDAELLKYAPFKLTAIVNRLDLRAGNVHKKIVSNPGETRFIFTLLDPFPAVSPSTQRPPQHIDPSGIDVITVNSITTHQPEVIDWQGFNVILEYANVATTHCQLRQLARDWVALNALTLGLSSYNSALQAITDQVTVADAKPGWANGSAIRSIRTNERVFAFLPAGPSDNYCGQSGGAGNIGNFHATWHLNDWELRQFGLDPTSHLLKQVVVENTPVAGTNCQENLSVISPCSTAFCSLNSTVAPELASWIESHQSQVALGRHQLPAEVPGQIAMLAASSIVSGDFAHYHDIDWSALPSLPANHRVLRQQLSLNTCGGCHTGETKTMFAHVLPTVSGESANYWQTSSPPDTKEALADWASSPSNVNGQFSFPDQTFQHWVKVSAFLTGRNYSGHHSDSQSPPTYDDDDPNDFDDESMNGLFRVADPASNSPISFVYPGTMLFGYNDLERRRLDLCRLVKADCESREVPVVMSLLKQLTFSPLPKGAH